MKVEKLLVRIQIILQNKNDQGETYMGSVTLNLEEISRPKSSSTSVTAALIVQKQFIQAGLFGSPLISQEQPEGSVAGSSLCTITIIVIPPSKLSSGGVG